MVVTRPAALVRVIRRVVALYELCEVRPLTVIDSSSEERLSGSCGFVRVTVRERDSVRVRPESSVTVVELTYEDWMPKRGSGNSAVVLVVPSGCVWTPE